MYLFVSHATISRMTGEFDTETPQIRFPVQFVTRCVFTYTFLLFLGFFFLYHLFSFVAAIVLLLAIVYAFLIGKLFSVLGLSLWKYIVGNILWWALIGTLAILLRSALITGLASLL